MLNNLQHQTLTSLKQLYVCKKQISATMCLICFNRIQMGFIFDLHQNKQKNKNKNYNHTRKCYIIDVSHAILHNHDNGQFSILTLRLVLVFAEKIIRYRTEAR